MSPAFVMMVSSARPRNPNSPTAPNTPPNPPSHHQPRKRVRAPHLSRKYRTNVSTSDEAILVGDAKPSSKPDSSPSQRNSPSSGIVRSARSKNSVRFSRFPGSWAEVASQISTAASTAIVEGHDRIRIDAIKPELIADGSSTKHYKTEKNRHLRRVGLLVEACNSILPQLLTPLQTVKPDTSTYALCQAIQTATLHFNSAEDAEYGKRFLDPSLGPFVNIAILGMPDAGLAKRDLSILIAPSNRLGNPSHIESVELAHYSCCWTEQKIIIMLNPDLMALTRFASMTDEPRQPCFLSDYLSAYYIDPASFPSKLATGAVLRCFPRKWEMYLQKAHSNMGFRLVAEQIRRPSLEKIRCEFSWRVEKDVDGM